jgi:hypothetical protein
LEFSKRIQHHSNVLFDLPYEVRSHKKNRFKSSHFFSPFESIPDYIQFTEVPSTTERASEMNKVPLKRLKDSLQATWKIEHTQAFVLAQPPEVCHQKSDFREYVEYNIHTFHAFWAINALRRPLLTNLLESLLLREQPATDI